MLFFTERYTSIYQGELALNKMWLIVLFIGFLLSISSVQADEGSGKRDLGTGSFTVKLPPGVIGIPQLQYKTTRVTQKIPSNQWWSSLVWLPYSEAQYPHPLAVKAFPTGLQIYYPKRITANSMGIYGKMPVNSRDDFILGHSGEDNFPDARLDGFSDWFVTALFAKGESSIQMTYGHGSPFVYALYRGGNPKLLFTQTPQVWYGSVDSPNLGITVNGKHYGLFGPSGSTWSGLGTQTFINHPGGKNYFSIAVLPGKSHAILLKFKQYAYSHVTDTKVGWSFDPVNSRVITSYRYQTTAYEGNQTGTIFALYPHQWRNISKACARQLLPYSYQSVRGELKAATGDSLETMMSFPGILPSLPDCGSYDKAKLASYIDETISEKYQGPEDTYNSGKYLGKLAALLPISEQAGLGEADTQLQRMLKARLESWLAADDADGKLKPTQLFYYDSLWGTMVGYPASFGSDLELNDHHFHYGYFIRAAAEIARRDPDWADDAHWGGMVRLLIRDIASVGREDALFPFLRNFDVYAGHSWASGHGKFADGNNQESSSEAMNAWTGIILWGEATHNTDLRDLGIYLYTTEMNAIHEYWFDSKRRNFPAGYAPSVVTMVWGGKGANTTWWTSNPEEVHGINWLPFHGGSLYLGRYPEYVRRNYRALVSENGGARWDQWADLIWMWLALDTPVEAIRRFEQDSDSITFEAGNSKAFTYHWIHNLNVLGRVDQKITANYPLYAVFDKKGRKTYIVYNMTRNPLTITFSDGKVVIAPPREFTVAH
jgi:endoglucanase Acf2